MSPKKICRAVLFPHVAILIILLPVAAVFLVYSMVFLGVDSPLSIVSYVLAAYTLTVWCLRLPDLIRRAKEFRDGNRFFRLWREDPRFRVNVSLWGTLVWNTAYATLQLGMGIRHQTFWFCSLAAYYIALAVMRFFLARYTSKHSPGERMRDELKKYRACGRIFLLLNLALALMVFFMVYWNRTFVHHEITTIAMAAYTFTAFTLAIVNMVRYRKYNSPAYSASKAISFASASVSMLTLESTMLTTFGEGTVSDTLRKTLLGVTGGVISALIVVMAIYMIVQSGRRLRLLDKSEDKSNGK